MRYILGIDQSTQGTKAVLFDEMGRVAAEGRRKHRQIITAEGYIEHDPAEIMTQTAAAVRDALESGGIAPGSVLAIGLCDQRETVVTWDRRTGKPLTNAVVWQCGRAQALCRAIAEPDAAYVRQTTGLPLSPYFSAAKMAWLLRRCPAVQEAARQGTLCLGTVDTWLLFCLTEGRTFATDVSNASRTQLMDLLHTRWDPRLLALFGIPPEALPEIRCSGDLFGTTTLGGLFPQDVPIRAVMGDSHAALYGAGCGREGMAKATYGTGSSVMLFTGRQPVVSRHGLAATVAWGRNGQTYYGLEGNINYAGAVIEWLIHRAGLLTSADEAEALALQAAPADRTVFVPAFTGLGAPHWAPEMRAAIVGMGSTTGRAEIVRAAVDSIAYQVTDVLRAMAEDVGQPVAQLFCDGGAVRNRYLMQRQSELLRSVIRVAENQDGSCAGAAKMAGEAAGLYGGDTVFGAWQREYRPQQSAAWAEAEYGRWQSAVKQIKG